MQSKSDFDTISFDAWTTFDLITDKSKIQIDLLPLIAIIKSTVNVRKTERSDFGARRKPNFFVFGYQTIIIVWKTERFCSDFGNMTSLDHFRYNNFYIYNGLD